MSKIPFQLFLAFFCALNLFAQGKTCFLIAGQSNASGNGDHKLSISCKFLPVYEYKLSIDSPQNLSDPVGENFYPFESAKTGSAWPAFAKTFHEISGDTVIIIQAAKGGSSFYEVGTNKNLTWSLNGDLFGKAIEKVEAATAKLRTTLDGIIWSQGESDAFYINQGRQTRARYKLALKELIKRFRDQYGKALPFYIVQTGFAVGEKALGYEEVQMVQEEICIEVPFTYLVYSLAKFFPEYNMLSDYVHYNQEANNSIGKRIAEVVYQIENDRDFIAPVFKPGIYPNPTSSRFIKICFLNFNNYEKALIKVYSVSGELEKFFDFTLSNELDQTIEIDVSQFAAGVYVLRFEMDRIIFFKKIIIKN